MDTDKIIEEKKKIQTSLLDFLENETDKELHFQNLTKLLNENKNKRKEVYEFKEILYLINKIANNHHRLPNFNSEIIQIIDFLKQDIKENFVNSEILNIFQDNKLILLFLITNGILTINSNIADKMSDYFHFFYPELSTFNEEIKYDPPENFESLRSAGENDSYICHLIRNDSIDEFAKYITQTNFELSGQIPPSYFETNPFLLKHSKETTLIEYSAFCGAIQIFQFLKNKEVELKPSLWLYAIHSNNYDLIHLLEELGVVPEDKTYKRCLREALKCFHNEIANYIKDRLLDEKVKEGLGEKKFRDNLIDYCFHYYNLTFLPEKFDHSFDLYYYCLYNYFSLFKLLADAKGAQVLKERIIQKMIVFFFYQISKPIEFSNEISKISIFFIIFQNHFNFLMKFQNFTFFHKISKSIEFSNDIQKSPLFNTISKPIQFLNTVFIFIFLIKSPSYSLLQNTTVMMFLSTC